jgi:hypothetical protein
MSNNTAKPSAEKVIVNIENFVFSLEENMKPLKILFNENEIRARLRTLFKEFGWKFIDSGSFAQVYESPCAQYALKVNFDRDHYSYFAQMAISQPKNPYLPNIYWHVLPVNVDDIDAERLIQSVTLMELLEPMERADIQYDEPLADFLKDLDESCKSPKCHYIDGAVGDIARGFAEISEFVDLEFDLYDDTIGFSYSNIMYRYDQLVITDPIA